MVVAEAAVADLEAGVAVGGVDLEVVGAAGAALVAAGEGAAAMEVESPSRMSRLLLWGTAMLSPYL